MTDYGGADFTVGDPIEPATTDPAGWGTAPVPPPKKRRRWLKIGAPVTAVVLAAAGIAAAQLVSTLSGTDTPGVESALPAKTIAFAQVNIDPNSDQKLAIYDLGKKFPKVKDAVAKSDPAGSLIDYVLAQNGSPDDTLTWKGIKQWAGVRVGAALLAAAGHPYPLLAIQVKDTSNARAGLDKLKAQSPADTFYRLDGKYAYVSDTQAHLDDALKDLDTNGPLSATSAFVPAAKTVGDGDVLGGYANFAALKPIALAYSRRLTDALSAPSLAGGTAPDSSSAFDPAQLDKGLDSLKGVVTLHVELNGGGGQLAIDYFGTGSSLIGAATGVLGLPADSPIVFGVHGLSGTLLKSLTTADAGALAGLLGGNDLNPEDLAAALGDDLAVSVAGLSSNDPQWGVIVHGGDLDKAKSVINGFVRQSGDDFPGVISGSGDTYTVASSAGYAATLPGGNLGDNPLFKKAVPDAKESAVIGFVDLSKVITAEPGQTLSVLSAVGLSAKSTAGGAHFELNVLLK